jgi:predicted ribosomally synthesized peptide with SipW-like signal peptide
MSRTPSRRRRNVKVGLALGNVAALAVVSSLALFSDSATSEGTFSTGSVDLVLDGDTDDAQSFTSLSTADMVPGDETYAALPAANTGSLGFTYGMTTAVASGDATLGAGLDLGVAVVAGATCDAGTYAAGTEIVSDGSVLSTAAFSGRTLASGADETLCYHVELPAGADNTLQGQSVTTTFTFTATQA